MLAADLLQEGAAVMTKAGRPVGEVGPGGHFGEMATLGFRPQPATVAAGTPVRAVMVGRRHLLCLVHDQPLIQSRLFPDIADGGLVTKLRELRAQAAVEWRTVNPPKPARPGRGGPLELGETRPGRTVRATGTALPMLGIFGDRGSRPAPPAPTRPMGWRARAAIASVCVLLLAGAAALYHPPMIVVTPLPPIDVSHDITVVGAPVHPVHGRYLLLPVRLARPNAFGALLAFAAHRHRLPAGGGSEGTPAEARRLGEAEFRQSELDAAAAAARAVGIDVHLGGDGAWVLAIRDRASVGELREGDVIVALDGVAVRAAPDVDRLMAERPPGPGVVLTVERDSRRLDVTITGTGTATGTGAGLREGPGAGLPVVLETLHPTFSLPFGVSFRRRAISGPSGGLVYALAMADMLGSRDLAQGHTIAATGAIDPGGDVAPIGFLLEKAGAARRSQATDFFVPASQWSQASDADQAGRGRRLAQPVEGVLTLEEALRRLAAGG